MVKRGLGKGLNALIPNDSKLELSDTPKIKLSKIEPNNSQPRKKFDEESLNELANSIKEVGIIQPLVVAKNGKFYEIIAGERRWRAAKIAGIKEVPVIIKNISKKEKFEVALIENIQRKNLNPIEEARAYKRLIEEFHLKQEEIAKKVAKSRTAIANILRLLQLSENIQVMLMEELISNGHARALLSIKNKKKQYELAKIIVEKNLSVRETEKLIKKYNGEVEKKRRKKVLSPEIKAVEKRVEEIFGTKVSINDKNNKGKIEIEYYSHDELERIIDIIEQLN